MEVKLVHIFCLIIAHSVCTFKYQDRIIWAFVATGLLVINRILEHF